MKTDLDYNVPDFKIGAIIHTDIATESFAQINRPGRWLPYIQPTVNKRKTQTDQFIQLDGGGREIERERKNPKA